MKTDDNSAPQTGPEFPNRPVVDGAAVGIDRSLEAGQDLIGPGVDRVSAFGVRLPARDPYRENRGSGRNAVEPIGPFGSRDDARELGAVALGPARDRRMRLRDPSTAGVDDVDAREHAPPQVRM